MCGYSEETNFPIQGVGQPMRCVIWIRTCLTLTLQGTDTNKQGSTQPELTVVFLQIESTDWLPGLKYKIPSVPILNLCCDLSSTQGKIVTDMEFLTLAHYKRLSAHSICGPRNLVTTLHHWSSPARQTPYKGHVTNVVPLRIENIMNS